ncbi:S8 family peptidase [Fluviicola taffensis]|nr:S8 family peptidase [Fluviicola taffensis]
MNELLLNSNATYTDLLALKDSIIASGQLRMFAPVLTKYPYNANVQQRYYRTDDQLLITFHDPLIDSATIASFANEYQLKLVHKPSTLLNNSVSWGYIFKLDAKPDTILNTIIMANVIATYESALVKYVTPNIIGGDFLDCGVVSEMNTSTGGISGTWHIRNEGQVIWNGQSGVNDADADICECWGAGFTGDGVKIGVIDEGGFESSHPDIKPFGAGFNATLPLNTYPPSGTDFYSDYSGHGMAVSGVIGATPNNTSLGERWAAGVAYDATLHPYLVNLSATQVLEALQAANEMGMDVVNMSFRIPFDANINNHITNSLTTTRFVNGQYRGVIFVAATGNDNLQASNFPANHPGVIGVGMTNPEDYRSNYDLVNTWTTNPNKGSTYGPPSFNYDVVAPGEIIMTLDLKGANGFDAGDYIVPLAGTSFSTPIVSGIASILLQKNPNLTYAEVKNLIRNGADKVRPSTYNYSMYPGTPGYNNEMFYGRVSCINSLNQVLGINENSLQKLTVQSFTNYNYVLVLPEFKENQRVTIVNALGQTVWEESVVESKYGVEFSMEKFSSGLYLLNLYENEVLLGNFKLIK